MSAIRFLVWAGVFGWGLILLNFSIAFLRRRSLIRFTWALAACAAGAFLLSRLMPLPFIVRAGLDSALALGGLFCGAALTITLLRKGWGVLG